MSSILEVVHGIRDLLEPEPTWPEPVTVKRDLADAKPFIWQDDTFYVYHTRLSEIPVESGPVVRQDFAVSAVLVLPSAEEADLKRKAEISAALDAKRSAYMDAVRANQVGALWDHIRAAEATPPHTLQTRAMAIDITGYRIVA